MGCTTEERKISKIIFDTDILIWYFRGNNNAHEFITRCVYEDRSISSLCIMELIQGCKTKQELKLVKEFIQSNFFNVIHPDENIAEKAILLLERYAFSDGLHAIDAIIAATALTANVTLATSNHKHFKNIQGLTVIKFEPDVK